MSVYRYPCVCFFSPSFNEVLATADNKKFLVSNTLIEIGKSKIMIAAGYCVPNVYSCVL